MRRLIIVAALLSAGHAQAANEKIAAACKADAVIDAAGCACLQTLADGEVRVGLHGLVADHLGREVDVAEITAEGAHSDAEALYDAHAAFHKKAETTCGMPKLGSLAFISRKL